MRDHLFAFLKIRSDHLIFLFDLLMTIYDLLLVFIAVGNLNLFINVLHGMVVRVWIFRVLVFVRFNRLIDILKVNGIWLFTKHSRKLLRQILNKHVIESTNINVQLLSYCQFSLLSKWKFGNFSSVTCRSRLLIMRPKSVPFFVVNRSFHSLVSTAALDCTQISLPRACFAISEFFLKLCDTTLESLYFLFLRF